MRHMSARVSWILFGVVIALLVGVGVIATRLTKSLFESEQWVSHTHEVQGVLGSLRGRVVASDNVRLRSLLITPAPAVPEYAIAQQGSQDDLAELRGLTRDNSRQQLRLEELSKLVDQKFSILNRSADLFKSKKGLSTEQNELSLESLQVSNRLAEVLNSMEAEENALLQSRKHVSAAALSQVQAALTAAFGAAVLILFFTFYQLTIELRNRKRAEEAVRLLSARLLQLQDMERRKVARELHDSIGQYFVSLKMNFDFMRSEPSAVERERILEDCRDLLDRGIVEARTLSHLLHPPLLDEAGFLSAARWYVEGFTDRSKIQVKLDTPDNLPRLGKDIELALFRVLQESLTNIHRHSGTRSAEISLTTRDGKIRMTVRDFGKGIPASLLKQFEETRSGTGVGLAGMRERMSELGGTMELSSNGPGGTLLEVMIPLPPADGKAPSSSQTPQSEIRSSADATSREKEDAHGLLFVDAFPRTVEL